MKEIILIKLGEIVLKGLNRQSFEFALIRNLRRRLEPLGKFDIREAQSTIYVEPLEDGIDLEAAAERVGKVFGVIAFSRACMAEKNMDSILKTAADYLRDQLSTISSFKVESKRSDKHFPLKSPEISAAVGEYLLQQFPNLHVACTTPTWRCGWRSATSARISMGKRCPARAASRWGRAARRRSSSAAASTALWLPGRWPGAAWN